MSYFQQEQELGGWNSRNAESSWTQKGSGLGWKEWFYLSELCKIDDFIWEWDIVIKVLAITDYKLQNLSYWLKKHSFYKQACVCSNMLSQDSTPHMRGNSWRCSDFWLGNQNKKKVIRKAL